VTLRVRPATLTRGCAGRKRRRERRRERRADDGGTHTTEGLPLRATSATIAKVDSPDGDFVVEGVTGLVEYDEPFDDGPPDTVHTYLGRPESVAAAGRGTARGTAVISEDFLDEVRRGMASYDIGMRIAFDAEQQPQVPVVRLVRTLRDPSQSIVTSRIPELC
jgi:hypothetical protein